MSKKSYSHFTYQDLKALGLEIVEERLFVPAPAFVEPSDFLKNTLEINLDVPMATEKAKSELLITPILNEIRIQSANKFTYFSGYNFDVEPSKGLRGFCDFILTKAPKTPFIEKPILAIVEAKNAEIEMGIAQCGAEMYAAQLFNQRQNEPISTVYGAVTSGFDWLFMSIQQSKIQIDTRRYFINNLPELLGVFNQIIL
ncbi:MAG: hypothetical protein MUE30_10505 [Spirosomaceae bacterium]|jgi:hypothetical protein|nr:hypothetical protein [Spirosomataceae bacterium]